MHVLVVTVVHHPLDARIHGREIESLVRAGHEVTYAAPWGSVDRPPWRPGPRLVELPRAVGRKRLRALLAAARVMRRHDGHVDIVLVHDPELVPVATLLVRRSAVVWDVHEDLPAAIGEKGWIPSVLRPVLSGLARSVLGVCARRVHLVLAEQGYARDWPDRPVVANTTWIPSRVGPPDDGRIVYVGRVSTGRGVGVLLAVARDPRLRGRLHVYGPADDDVASDLEEADRRGELHWHGFVPNEAALASIEGASVGLSPLRDMANYRHSLPTKVVEYMARGIPVVTTPLPRAVELVERDRCGLVVDFDDAEGFADACARLLDDPALRAELGARGHAAAHARHDWERDGSRFVEILSSWARPAGGSIRSPAAPAGRAP